MLIKVNDPTRTVISLLPLIFPEKEAPSPGRRRSKVEWSGEGWENSTSPRIESNRIGRFIEGAASKRIDVEIVKPKEEREGAGGDQGNILWRYFDVGYGMLVNIVPWQNLRRGFCSFVALLSYHQWILGKEHKGTQTSWGALSTIWCVARVWKSVSCESLSWFVSVFGVLERKRERPNSRLSLPSPSLLSPSSSGKLGANHILLPATFKIASS